jgi:IclR family transcriptional regulator, KDG regulon repressor
MKIKDVIRMAGVINKSVSLLALLKPIDGKEDWSTTEISKELNIPIQTVHRLLTCLCEVGFVVQNMETRKYRLGFRIMELGLSVRESMEVRNASLPFLIKLSNETKESVYLSIAEGSEGVIIDCVNSIHPIYNFITDVERNRLPICVDAANKVILANLNLRLRDKLITELMKQKIVEDRMQLETELRMIKSSGFSLTFGERITGMTSIAAPIFSWDNTPVAAINISIDAANRWNELNGLIDLIISYSKKISEDLGWIA